MILDELKQKHPKVAEAFALLDADNGADPLPGGTVLPEALLPLLDPAERFLSVLGDEAFEVFVCGEQEEAENIGIGVVGREEAGLVCESWFYGLDPDEAQAENERLL